jgi:hypothetical protein
MEREERQRETCDNEEHGTMEKGTKGDEIREQESAPLALYLPS